MHTTRTSVRGDTVLVSVSTVADTEGLAATAPGDAATEVHGGPVQHPILTGHDGGHGESQDCRAYAMVVEACEVALRTLCVSDRCEATLRRSALAARELAQLPLRELRQVPLREAG